MTRIRTSVSGEKNVMHESCGFLSAADTPKHTMRVSASSWFVFWNQRPGIFVALCEPAAETITSFEEPSWILVGNNGKKKLLVFSLDSLDVETLIETSK